MNDRSVSSSMKIADPRVIVGMVIVAVIAAAAAIIYLAGIRVRLAFPLLLLSTDYIAILAALILGGSIAVGLSIIAVRIWSDRHDRS